MAVNKSNVKGHIPAQRPEAKPKRAAARSAPVFAPAHVSMWKRYASGLSLRALARGEGMSRSAVERIPKAEGGKRERTRLRAAAAARASKTTEDRLAARRPEGLLARIAAAKRGRGQLER